MAFPTNPFKAPVETSSPFKALTDMLFHPPFTDETKIQFLKEELSAGRYHVQSKTLAEKLMEHIHFIQQPIAEEIF